MMESPNPRRRQLSVAPPTLLSTTDLYQKGATFHAPNPPKSSHSDPILSISTLPQRSSTCIQDLEALLKAGQSRIASILGAVDRSFSDLSSFSTDSQETVIAEPEPVPAFMLAAINQNDSKNAMDIDAPAPRRKHHASDSGIGSSETSIPSLIKDSASSTHGRSAINGSSLITPRLESATHQALSEYACRQIQKHIIVPIIREQKLKPFHSLVHGLPYRVARKEITCLRDLEKVILWLAPKWATSRKSYLDFCHTSIQCIHTTVEHLSGSDLARPTDRPYTNGYFLDLVEQVRQYAAIMSAERARTASAGQNANAPIKNDKLNLVGGLSRTGKPAELVRTVDGKSYSLRTGQEIDMEDYKTGVKRSFEDLDDNLERSMARRKKNAPRIDYPCQDCGKAFKRPCDLTKHEKTHSRPWKCDEVGCKYHTYGWPTEKERDRHMNDKHSAAPKMYKCEYSPCPYESKRESNCKQHMEKAHGYVYVRAKNNGKVRAPSTVGAPTTPQMSTPGSHAFSAPTPDFSDAQSINESLDDIEYSGMPTLRYLQEATNFHDIFGPSGTEFNFADPPFGYPASDPNMVTPPAEQDSIFGSNFDWSNTDVDLTSFNAQILTPALSYAHGLTSSAPSVNQSPPSTCLSPHGLGEAMLFSPIDRQQPQQFCDEGYSELTQGFQPLEDFHLYNSNSPLEVSPSMDLFGALPSYEKNSQLLDIHQHMLPEFL